MGYGRASATVGNIFPWVFTAPATYWGGASAGVQYITKELGGKDKMKGKKVAYVYIDIAYGKEPIPVFQNYAQELGFQLELVPVPAPGLEQKSIWLQIRQMRPDYVYLQGWGAMNAGALAEAAKTKFPMDKFVGIWWSGSDADLKTIGEAGKGYRSISWSYPVSDSKVMKDIKQLVVEAGHSLLPREEFDYVFYQRGVVISMFVVEGIKTTIPLHREIFTHTAFIDGHVDTGLVERTWQKG